ncbi:MAG: VWA domain-containing protein [Acidobacteriota bacterium]
MTDKVHSVALRTLLVLLSNFTLFVSPSLAQKQSQQNPNADDVVRVKTELVQTDVTVVDKRGNFVDGLKAEQFDLRVDAKSTSLAFFDQVAAGSPTEEKQLAASRKGVASGAGPESRTETGADRGRLIFFFVDDVHLSGASMARARALLSRFVENKMGVNDRVAVVSTSGQIGFLQQLTDNKAVLREAIARLNYKSNPETTASQVRISEVDANLVASRGDRGLFAYLVEATMQEFQTGALNAANIVKNRVRQINAQAKVAEVETLSRLESLIRSTSPLAGRKLIFFVSDGFVMDSKRSSGTDVMRRAVNQAANVGAVIYTLDTRENFLGAGVDASRNDHPEFGGRLAIRNLAESKTPQEPLQTLAEETGGRSYLNSNALDEGLAQALRETSSYYLLAWRPDTENQREGKSRLQIIIRDRPDLRVRMRRHFLDLTTLKAANSDGNKPSAGTPENELRAALASLYPRQELPTSLSAGYLNMPEKGTALSVSMQIDSEMLSFDGPAGKQEAVVDVLGVALDDRGKFSSFKQKLNVPRGAINSREQRLVTWSELLPLPPGLYQVRLAVRDSLSGRTGSAIEWIEIPSVGPESFSLSSLFLGERAADKPLRVNVDRRFARTSVLRFQTYVYAASRRAGAPEVWIQARVLRASQQVSTVAPSRMPTDISKDPQRLPYWSEIDLHELQPGWYTLEVTANDRVAGTTVTQRVKFAVE